MQSLLKFLQHKANSITRSLPVHSWFRAVLVVIACGVVSVGEATAFPATGPVEAFEIVCNGYGCQFGYAPGGVVPSNKWRDTFADACSDTVGTIYNNYTVVSASIGAGGKCWGSAPPGYPSYEYVWASFKSRWYTCPANSSYTGSAQCTCNAPLFKESLNTPGTCSAVVTLNDAGKATPNCPKCGNPINILTGTKSEKLKSGFLLGGLELTLTYDTTDKAPADQANPEVAMTSPKAFGALWRSNFHHKLEVAANSKGALLSRGDGAVINFSGNGAGVFTAAGGDNPHKLSSITGGYRFTDVSTGVLETFDASGKLVSLAAADGTVLTFSYSDDKLVTVQTIEGRIMGFTYNSNGLVTQVAGPDGRVAGFAYDATLNLTSVTWPDAKVLGFVYEDTTFPWALTGKVDENNSRFATFAYDSMGRAISTEHAGGVEKYSVNYGEPPQRSVAEYFDTAANVWYRTYGWNMPTGTTMTTPNGQSVGFDAALVAGVPAVTGSSQAAGSGSAASISSRTYDANGNIISWDDFNGARTCSTYDSSNRETVRVEGLATSVACSSVTPANSTLPAGARKISTTWHPDWSKPTQVTEQTRKTTFVYQGQPDPFNSNVAANCTSAATRADGKPLPLVCKHVVQATTDASANGVDTNLNSVQLLLHGNGAHGSSTFADSSNNNLSPSLTGTPVISTTQSKYGGAAMSFNGTADALSYAHNSNLNLASGDFTIEAWIYVTSLATHRTILQKDQAYGITFPSYSLVITTGGGVNAFVGTGASASYAQNVNTATGLITTGAWHHVAFTRQSTTLRIFVNGALAQTATQTGTPTDGGKPLVIGRYPGGGGAADGWMAGYIDDLRITKGVARYTAAFTPSAQEVPGNAEVISTRATTMTYDSSGRVLSSVDPRGKTTTFAYYADASMADADPYIDKVVLLLHGNGANNSTSITDSSPSARSLTVVGNAKLSTTQSKFGGTSMAFDGAGDYLSIPYSTDFAFGSSDFTIEMFVYKTANHANTSRLWNPNGDVFDGVNMGIDSSGNFAVYASTNCTTWGYPLAIVANLANGQWYHLAMVRSGGSLYAFVNGTRYVVTTALGTVALCTNSSVGRIIGGQAGVDRALNGYIDEFRITKGVARYTANFTSPIAEYANVGPSTSTVGHVIGDLQTVTNAAAHVAQYTLYDPAGRVRQMVDPKGVTTDITYTARGKVSTVVVTPPGGSARTTTYTYDYVGQMTGVALPDGTSLTYSYDAAHRLTGVVDQRGNAITYTLDNTGNRIGEEVRDPGNTLQRSISRSYDALNRLQQVTGAAQ